ncbi:MAG: glycosyltransferase involved in cell wall biosynthesis [Rubritalea sp.]|jgi:glycosyltransferase involved in cell wall biosynthesis
MRILHSVASLNPSSGGPARSVPQLALALAQLGIEIGLWSAEPVGGLLADLTEEQSRHIKLYSGSFPAALEAFGVPDLVHDHGIWLPCHREVARVCKVRGIPRMVSPRGMLEPWALNHKKWKKRLAWWLYQKRDLQSALALHATAEQEMKNLKRLDLKTPMVVLSNGVKLPKLETVNIPVPVNNGFRSALFLGRTHPIKGLPSLIKAWEKVMPNGWTMRVVGPDEDGHLLELKEQVEAAGLSEVWRFEDSLEGDAKWQAMADADLFILPSHSENFGIVVAESLACGTPVITTTGTPWQGLQEHECGWWVKPEVDDLTVALKTATTLEQDGRQKMGRRGQAWVAEEFAWPTIAKKSQAFYQQILDV